MRDCLHPADLVALLAKQFDAPKVEIADRTTNFSGGQASAISSTSFNAWCNDRFGVHKVAADTGTRAFDIPWMVLDSSKAERVWGWKPRTPTLAVLEEIAAHAGTHPDWLELSAPLG